MTSHLIPLPLVVLLSLLLISNNALISAAPQPGPIGKSIGLSRRRPGPVNGSFEEWGLWAKNQKEILQSKYGGQKVEKRTSGMNL
jgi:cathepsin D